MAATHMLHHRYARAQKTIISMQKGAPSQELHSSLMYRLDTQVHGSSKA